MFLILLALFIVQISYLIIALFVFGISKNGEDPIQMQDMLVESEIEGKWHQEANALQNVTSDSIQQHFDNRKQQHPKASMFWVDGQGLANQEDVMEQLPAKRSSAYTAKFIKEHYGETHLRLLRLSGKNKAMVSLYWRCRGPSLILR